MLEVALETRPWGRKPEVGAPYFTTSRQSPEPIHPPIEDTGMK